MLEGCIESILVKKEVQIYDYVDKNVPVLWKMHQRRLKVYKAMDYVEST